MTNTQTLSTWNTKLKQAFTAVLLIAVSLLVGIYIVAPGLAKNEPGYTPRNIVQLPAGTVRLTNADGLAVLLPVRILETTETRRTGMREIGPSALDTTFLLYAQPRELTNRTTYSMEGIRAPLEFAIIDAEGGVVAIKSVAPGAANLSVTEKHRWMIAAKQGMFAHYGITTDTVFDTEGIRKKR